MFKEMPSHPEFPVVVGVSHVLSDDGQSAILWLRGQSVHSVHITVVHEGAGIAKYELHGDESGERLCVRHGECIIIIARHKGEVVAHGLFQVNLGIYAQTMSVLLPMGSNNLVVAQASVEGLAKVEVAA